MKSRRGFTTLALLSLLCMAAMATLSCNFSPVAGRFTYIVKYDLTAEFTTTAPTKVNIQYKDDTGTQIPLPFTSPQSFEFTMSYDYTTPFNPEMTFSSATFTDLSDKLFIKIILKDYRTNFEEEVLASAEILGSAPGALTIYGQPLPK